MPLIPTCPRDHWIRLMYVAIVSWHFWSAYCEMREVLPLMHQITEVLSMQSEIVARHLRGEPMGRRYDLP